MVSFPGQTPGVSTWAAPLPQPRQAQTVPAAPLSHQPTFGFGFPRRKAAPLLLFILALLSPLTGSQARAQQSGSLTADAYRNAIVSAAPDALSDARFDSAEFQATLNDPDTPDEQLPALEKMDYFVRSTPGHDNLTLADLNALQAAGNGQITADVVDRLPEILEWPAVPCPKLTAEDLVASIVATVPQAMADQVIDSAELQRTINNPDTPEEQREPLRKLDHFLRNTPGHSTLTVADLEKLEQAGDGKITPEVVDRLPEILGWPKPPCNIYFPVMATGKADLSAEGYIKMLVWANNDAMVDDRIDSAELQAALNHPDTPEAFKEPMGTLDWHLRNNEGGHTYYTRDDLYALQEAGDGEITKEVADRLPEILDW